MDGMNDSLKNTQNVLSKIDGLSAEKMKKVNDNDSGNLINFGNANTASRTRYVKSNQNEIVGRELLNQLGTNTQSLKSPIPMQSLSETVKNEIEKDYSYMNNTNTMQPTPPNHGLPKSLFSPTFNTNSPLKKSRGRKTKAKRYPKGSEVIGLSPGFKNGRQMQWERMNNDKHLKHNINNLKSRFSQRGKIGPKAAEKRRLERDKMLKLKLENRDNVKRCDLAYQSFSGKNFLNFSVHVKNTMVSSKKSRVNFFKAVKKTLKHFSLDNLEILRFWFEIIFHTENHETLEKSFPLTLKKLFEKYHNVRKDAEILLMSYLERRLVVQSEIYDSNKALVLFRYLYELQILPSIVVKEWRHGKMPEKHELQVVPGMRFQDGILTIARSKLDPFLEWVTAVELEAIDQKLRHRDVSKMQKTNKVQGPFKSILPPNKQWMNNMKKV